MKKNNTLLLVASKEIYNKAKEESNITFLFPIEKFSVGFSEYFKIEEINIDNAYIFVNRVMDNNLIDDFKIMLKNLPSNIKGIVFDDLGVLNILINEKINLTKILFLNHLNCNYLSINSYLEYVDSVIPSVDITTDEIDEILNKSYKKLVLYTFGHVNIMYSRRNLITSYNNYFNKNMSNNSTLEEKVSKKHFKIIENKDGTVIYTNEPFNGLILREKDNVLFNLINTVFLDPSEVLNIINSKDNLENKYPYKYLSEEKTIFKIKEVDV